MNRIITTSWDDGDVIDMKLADLLLKYNLKGTFYIPRDNDERKVLTEDQIIELSQAFEIGGHTLHHRRVDNNSRTFIEQEINGSFLWLKDLLAANPVSFCFPLGKYNALSLASVFNSGYKLARTTELLSTSGLYSNALVPTTFQLYEHGKIAFIKNTLRRFRWISLSRWLVKNSPVNLLQLTDTYLNTILASGGCLHIWGHSWEIEKFKLWNKLEEVFRMISNIGECSYLQNREMLRYY